jgi:uncharacterized protein involved in outer membrane biogenesis
MNSSPGKLKLPRYLKWAVGVFLAFIVLCVLFVATFDVNQYRGRIENALSQSLGRQVELRDEMSMALSLIPTMVARDIHIKNSDWAASKDFVFIEELRVEIELLPLILDQTIRADYLVIRGANLSLEKNDDQENNWAFLFQNESSGESSGFTGINEIRILDSKVTYRTPDSEPKNIGIKRADAVVTSDKPLYLKFNGTLDDEPVKAEVKGELFSKYLKPSPRHTYAVQLEHKYAKLSSNIKIERGEALDIHLDAIRMDFNHDDLKDLKISDGDLQWGKAKDLKLSLKGVYSDLPLNANLSSGNTDLLQADKLNIPLRLDLSLGKNKLDAKGTIAGDFDRPETSLQIDTQGESLDQLASLFDIALPEATQYQLKTKLTHKNKQYQLDIQQAAIGKNSLAGKLNIDHGQKPLKISGSLTSNQLTIAQGKKEAKKKEKAPSITLPGDIDLDLQIKVKSVKGLPVAIGNIESSALLKNEKLELSNLEFTIPSGRVNGSVKLHSEKEVLHYAVDLSSGSQDIAKIPGIPELGDKTISGNMKSVKLSMKGQLKQTDEWLKQSRVSLQAGQSQISLLSKDKSQQPEQINLDALLLETVQDNSVKLKLNGKHRDTPVSISLVTVGLSELANTKKPVPVNLDATYGEFQLQADGTYDDMQKGEGVQLAIKLKGKQPETNEQESLKGNFTAKKQHYVLSDLSGHIGNTDLKGSVDVSTSQADPYIRADLTSNNLHYYDLVEKETEAEEQDKSKEKKRLVPETKIPVELMRAYDAEIKVSAVHFFIGDIEYSNFKLQAILKDDVLTVKPFEASLRGIAVKTFLVLYAKEATPSGQLQFNTKQADYGDLLESLEVTDKVEGLADVEISLQGRGDTLRDMVINSEGYVQIISGEGKIRDANFDLWAADLTTSLVSGALTTETVTQVNCTVGRFDIKNGIVISDSLMLDTDKITVAGTAKIDLLAETIEAFIQPAPKNPSLVSLANPVRLSGDVFAPTVTVEKTRGRNWMLKGVLLGLANPATLLVMYADLGSGEQNPCAKAVLEREAIEEKAEEEGKELEALKLPGKLIKTLTSPFRSEDDEQ